VESPLFEYTNRGYGPREAIGSGAFEEECLHYFFLETMIAFITRLFIAVCPVGTLLLTEWCEMVSIFRHSENSVKTT
jgi:hypothetical protein